VARVTKSPDARRPDGRSPLLVGRGKSGLHGGAVPGNARRGRPQGKCHRKYTAGPFRETARGARVKRCGKSAPRRRRRRRQGKPHREQDQVGAAGIPENFRKCRASLRAAARVGRTRRSATSVPEEWPSPPGIAPRAGQNPAYTPSGTFLLRTFHEHYNSDAAFCDLGQGDSYMLWSRHTDGGHFRNSRFYL
jgi:hypothetical protein